MGGRGAAIRARSFASIEREETIAAGPAPFIVLRHRTPSSPICLSEVTEQALRLIASILLIQQREKYPSREGKSAFL